MLNRILPATLLVGAVALASPALAQNARGAVGGATGGVTIATTTSEDNAAVSGSARIASESTATAEDGTVVVTRREQVRVGEVRVPRSGGNGPNGGSVVGGGVGGAIGGRDIIGTTPADNAPLPLTAKTP